MTASTRELDPTTVGDHIDRLYRAAWALCGNGHEAEDLVQETYARVLARPRFLRKDDDLGYLLRALRNTFYVLLRTKKRQVSGQPVSADADPVDRSLHRQPEQEAETREVYTLIAALPEPYREAIVAVDVTGLSYDEAAKALKVRVGTVRSRLFRARDQVAAGLEAGQEGEER